MDRRAKTSRLAQIVAGIVHALDLEPVRAA
jgi:hypothetical protein